MSTAASVMTPEAVHLRALLDLRSAALARRGRAQEARQEAGRQPFLICACGAERYGLPLSALAGVLPGRACTPLPGAPPALRGIIAHAGAIVSVLDLGRVLGAGAGAADEGGAGHLVRLRAQEPAVALAVDRVLGLALVLPAAILRAAGGEAGSGTAPGLGAEAITGYCPAGSDGGGEGFSVVDVACLLRPYRA